MLIYMVDNPYRFDVEQTAIILMPSLNPSVTNEEPPRAPISEDYAVSTLIPGPKSIRADFFLQIGGQSCTETCISVFDEDADEEYKKTETRHTIRRSVFKAYVKLTNDKPAWGALAGVRPVKLARGFLEEGKSPTEVSRLLENRYYVRKDKVKMLLECATHSLALKSELEPFDAALYVGIPYCPTRCSYCSFTSKATHTQEELDEYLKALTLEIHALSKSLEISKGRVKLKAVYIGGGTPTVLNEVQLSALLATIGNAFTLAKDCEYTVEAGRPDTITIEKLEAIVSGGAERISINPQSFSQRVLRNIGRKHGVDEIYRAFEKANSVPGLKVNMDLIAGLPGDNLAGFAVSVKSAVELSPENITVHTLAVKKGATIAKESFEHTKPEIIHEMLKLSEEMLREQNYNPYYLYRQKYSGGSFENVGYARLNEICRYNIYMMDELLPVLGVGAGAVTKLGADGQITRLTNPKYGVDYMRQIEDVLLKKDKIAAYYLEKLQREL